MEVLREPSLIPCKWKNTRLVDQVGTFFYSNINHINGAGISFVPKLQTADVPYTLTPDLLHPKISNLIKYIIGDFPSVMFRNDQSEKTWAFQHEFGNALPTPLSSAGTPASHGDATLASMTWVVPTGTRHPLQLQRT